MKTRTIFSIAAVGLLLANCAPTELNEARIVSLELPAQPYNYDTGGSNLPTLGRVLFYDRALSINNSVSCSSCHKQELGFADNVQFSTGFEAKLTTRNSMPIQNLGNEFVTMDPTNSFIINSTKLFWDGRETELQSMVLKPLINHVEMGVNDIESFTRKVSSIPYYQDLFTKAYGDATVTSARVASALSSFVRNINTKNTKFDEHVRKTGANLFSVNSVDPAPGFTPNSVLSPLEDQGWKLFLQKYDCNSCHQVQAPSGYVMAGTFANIGLDRQYSDNGLSGVTRQSRDDGKFKIPSLRNVALTAPYMHDGRFTTLSDVIDHYKNGIANHPNLDSRLRNRDGTARIMDITEEDKTALIAFLHTLTDNSMLNDPRLSNPFKVK
jgi:cytochrome c peroxidase